jgi:hypothetical protein
MWQEHTGITLGWEQKIGKMEGLQEEPKDARKPGSLESRKALGDFGVGLLSTPRALEGKARGYGRASAVRTNFQSAA